MVLGIQGHAPCKTSCPKNPHGCQLLWSPTSPKVLCVEHAYHKKKGATPHLRACKQNLQYDGKLDGCFGLRVGAWNLGTLCVSRGEVCEELRKGKTDVCCLQEVRWRGQGARILKM